MSGEDLLCAETLSAVRHCARARFRGSSDWNSVEEKPEVIEKRASSSPYERGMLISRVECICLE